MNNKVLFISSTGGHFSEMMSLKEIMLKQNYFLITEKTASTKSLKEEHKKRMGFLVYGTREHLLSYPFKFAYNCIKSLVYFIRENPQVIVTTGTHTAIPMCVIAKLFKRRVIYIETFANVFTPTATGKYIYEHKIATKFIVQHEELLKIYPEAIYLGGVF